MKYSSYHLIVDLHRMPPEQLCLIHFYIVGTGVLVDGIHYFAPQMTTLSVAIIHYAATKQTTTMHLHIFVMDCTHDFASAHWSWYQYRCIHTKRKVKTMLPLTNQLSDIGENTNGAQPAMVDDAPAMGLLSDKQNRGLRMRREYREHFFRHRGFVIPACITARA